jgi:glycosyltransferase involved in cell wall biosynthesis
MTDRSLNILHTEASEGWGGQEIRVLTEAAVFIKHGHKVTIAANAGSEILKAAPAYGVPAVAVPLRSKGLGAVRAMRRLLTDLRPDVVNTHSSIDSWVVALARFGLKHRPRVVRTRHISANVPRNFASRWIYRHGCDFVMTTGEAIVDQLTADGFLPRERVASVPTGIDTDRFSPGDSRAARRALGLPEDAFIFGVVATLRSWKGHAFLLDAFATANVPNSRLVIVGDGPQESSLKARIAELGLAGRVTMAGRQSDVVPWLRAFDVFVLPSYANEGIPQAILQAMAIDLPIISCPIGGIPECTTGLPGVTLVPPQDVDVLAAALAAAPAAVPTPSIRRVRAVERHSLEGMYRAVGDFFCR